jgi:hypothetical protein
MTKLVLAFALFLAVLGGAVAVSVVAGNPAVADSNCNC